MARFRETTRYMVEEIRPATSAPVPETFASMAKVRQGSTAKTRAAAI